MKYILLCVCLAGFGCATNTERVNNLKYFRDDKTGLCFVASALEYESAVLSNVPCTPEVERMIKVTR